jgi:hypothetical protein
VEIQTDFGLTLGAISTAVVIGASLRQVIAGSSVHRFGACSSCLLVTEVALAGVAILYSVMPETCDQRFSNPAS